MVILRNMKQEEFPAYRDYFVADYSQEIVENYGHTQEKAIRLAEQDLLASFATTLAESEHTLLCIDAEIDTRKTLVGYLWHCEKPSDGSTFIYDFYISPDFRGKGYGKQAIAKFESLLVATGIHQIKLRVAYHNQRALKLYQKTGFEITGYNMAKNID